MSAYPRDRSYSSFILSVEGLKPKQLSMAPVGHLWMQSRQRMHSGLFGVLTGSTPILQMRAFSAVDAFVVDFESVETDRL